MIYDDIKARWMTARKSKDTVTSNLLGTVKGEIDTKMKSPDATLNDDFVIKVVRSFVKSSEETLTTLQNYGTSDKVAVVQKELEILNSFLPQMMSDDDLRTTVQKIITDGGYSGMSDMGKVMGELKKLGPTVDMKKANGHVKELLL